MITRNTPGLELLASGEGSGAYGYGSRDDLEYYRDPKTGQLYCYEYSCCSCGYSDDIGELVETNIETMRKDYESHKAWDASKAEIVKEAFKKLEIEL